MLSLEQTQLTLRSPYLDNAFVRTVFRAPSSACVSDAVCLRLIADGDPRMRQLLTDRGVGGRPWDVRAAALRKTRGISFKAEYAYDYGMPQWLSPIDRMLMPIRPERMFLGRHKFYHYRVWYRDALSSYIREMLLDPRSLARPYVERKTMERVVEGHVEGRRNFTTAIHKLLTLELVHRLFVDAASHPASVSPALQPAHA